VVVSGEVVGVESEVGSRKSEAKPATSGRRNNRATGVCSGHGPELQRDAQATGSERRSRPRSRPTISTVGSRKSEARRSDEAEAVGRPASVRGTAPNSKGREATGSERRSRPRSRPTINTVGSQTRDVRQAKQSGTGVCFGARPRTPKGRASNGFREAKPARSRPTINTVGSRKSEVERPTRRKQSGDRRLFGARPRRFGTRKQRVHRDVAGSERRSRPRSRPTSSTVPP
jgi:hypothetical protein